VESLIDIATRLYRQEARARRLVENTGLDAAEATLAKVRDLDDRLNRVEAAIVRGELEASYAPEVPSMRDRLEAAIRQEFPLVFHYVDREGDEATRTLSPYELYEARDGTELVRGYDHDREELRSFRLDAMDDPHLALNTSFNHPA
jgi:predicted DNA-binding transcriptional regulator YafY